MLCKEDIGVLMIFFFGGGAVFTTVALALLYHMVMQLVKMLSTMQL